MPGSRAVHGAEDVTWRYHGSDVTVVSRIKG